MFWVILFVNIQTKKQPNCPLTCTWRHWIAVCCYNKIPKAVLCTEKSFIFSSQFWESKSWALVDSSTTARLCAKETAVCVERLRGGVPVF
jgi:hypothetical protein